MMTSPVVSLRHVTKQFDDLVAIDDFSLDVFPGEFLTLLGPSGCGKTTILRLIAGFEHANQGDILLNNHRVNNIPPNRRDVNTVFQSYALFPHMTVFENVAFGLKIKGRDPSVISKNVLWALELVKLGGMENRNIHQLSGGQKQRVAVARAFVNKPLVLLLDEPLSALDYRLRKEMQLELKHLQQKLGITFILVTHDQDEAITMSERIVVMNAGRLEQEGTPKRIYEDPINLFVAKFIGEINEFDGVVLSTKNGRMTANIESVEFDIANKKGFRNGQPIKILLRPEDIQVEKNEYDCPGPFWKGTVKEMIYKGSTVDVFLSLNGGKTIFVTEFFNEDAEDIRYDMDQTVYIRWIDGWEVVLPHE